MVNEELISGGPCGKIDRQTSMGVAPVGAPKQKGARRSERPLVRLRSRVRNI